MDPEALGKSNRLRAHSHFDVCAFRILAAISIMPIFTELTQLQSGAAKSPYTGHQPCPELLPGQMCFRANKYHEGRFESAFHQHIPLRRISQDRALETLCSLVAKYSDWPGNFILNSNLNVRLGGPPCYPGFTYDLSYPEPGVIRYTVGASSAHAWYDSVLSKTAFRAARHSKMTPQKDA